jgi:hypothetical protein
VNRSVALKLILVPCVMAPLSILGQTGGLEPLGVFLRGRGGGAGNGTDS